MTDEIMTIRQMCEAFDVTPRTLRFYEAKELIQPLREGTKRLYGRQDRARLRLILRGKRFGFSLEEIRQLLDLYDPHSQPIAQYTRAVEIGQMHLADMQRQREELTAAIDELQQQISWGEQMIAAMQAENAKTAAAG